jgi:hypothetical protein
MGTESRVAIETVNLIFLSHFAFLDWLFALFIFTLP